MENKYICQYINNESLFDKLKEINCPYDTIFDIQMWFWLNHNLFISVFLDEPFGKPNEYIYCIQSQKFGLDNYSTIVSDNKYVDITDTWTYAFFEALNYINNENER